MAGCKKSRGKNKPKMKYSRAIAKRFSVTKNGLIKYSAKGKRHCLSNKSRKRKRRLSGAKYLSKCNFSLLKRSLVI